MSITEFQNQASETPLVELLERVPEDARACYEHGPMNHSHIPYGLYCRQAAAELRRLRIMLDHYEVELRSALERIAELEAREQRADPLGQVLNEGDGVYRP